MKKIMIALVVLVVSGYVLYQNGSSWILRLLALTSGSALGTPAPSGAGIGPPYKNGTYTGNTADAFYGNIQVQLAIENGKIISVQFLQYPSDRTRSIAINTLAMPILSQEAIRSQTSQVDVVSGATDTSNAFVQSLTSALAQAK